MAQSWVSQPSIEMSRRNQVASSIGLIGNNHCLGIGKTDMGAEG